MLPPNVLTVFPLGHADPGFTLKPYIHLMDSGVGDAKFLDDAVKAGL